ncbi:MAG: (2Fe-2S)-binding protein [Euzebya sp.]
MYVCQCEAVTDRQIRGAVAEGCTTLRSVAALTGAGTGCGGCIPTLRALVCGSCPSRVVDMACDDTVGPVPVRSIVTVDLEQRMPAAN